MLLILMISTWMPGRSPSHGCRQSRFRTRDFPQAHPLKALIFMGSAWSRQWEKSAMAAIKDFSYEYPVRITTKGA